MKNQKRFKPYQPNQLFLLPPDMKQWLPDDHLVYFVMDVVSARERSKRPPTIALRFGFSPPINIQTMTPWPTFANATSKA
jgi:hypothetical protein